MNFMLKGWTIMNNNMLNEEYQYATLEEKIEMNRQERDSVKSFV